MRKIFFLFIILSLLIFFNFRSSVKKPPQKENPQLLASRLPINTSTAIGKRKSAAAPGKQVYSISQTTHSPNFTEAVIDPEDVKLGQTQTMTVTINDEKAPITEVIAEIETDKGIIKNTLNKISGTDQNGVWQGSWIVKDTHDTTYVTTFKAVNKIGEKGEARLSWTDPGCSTDTNKGTSFTTTVNCTITGVDGADGGTFTLAAGDTVTISAGATLVAGIFTIPASGGTLISNSTGIIDVDTTNVICMTDADADNYSTATTQFLSTTTCAAGKRRRNLMTSVVTLDCYDANANAKPGSGTCSASHRGDGSYDYNCSGGNSACGTGYNYAYSYTTPVWSTLNDGDPDNNQGECSARNSTCAAGSWAVYAPASIGCGQAGYAGCASTSTGTTSCITDGCYGPTISTVCTGPGAYGTQACQ